jgi:ketosteroid isomerase-like protein
VTLAGHPDIDLIRRYTTALAAGDMPTVLPFYADDLVVHVPGSSRHAGTYHGPEAVLEYYTRVGRDTDGGFRDVQVRDILASDEHVAVLVDWRLHRNGRTLDVDRVVIYRIAAERIAEIWVRDWDQAAYDGFFADA